MFAGVAKRGVRTARTARAAVRRGGKTGGDKGTHASHDFWGAKLQSAPGADNPRYTPLGVKKNWGAAPATPPLLDVLVMYGRRIFLITLTFILTRCSLRRWSSI